MIRQWIYCNSSILEILDSESSYLIRYSTCTAKKAPISKANTKIFDILISN